MKKQSNDVFFQFNAIIIFLIIMMYAVSIFFGGHYTPGGGFVGGLLLSSAVIIIGIAFDTKTLKKMFPFDFKLVTATGLFFCVLTPILSWTYNKTFFTHKFGEFHLPIFGEVHWHTAMLFDLGVLLAVVGTAITIILAIGENE
ncbi:Na(+)/H(+) antiporter subunit B [Mammaliicoccus sciuri]|jgi:multicomponent Na+:H+ antiporter subunit B|uniref:Na(+)/H(+) antiporter subunit B n=3 Tax=Mammaliicoccus sciuri TaxID=1296 RepID=A0A1X0TYF8_MAMSC|nr:MULTISPECIES: Na(+)/H(+) antiporter subunit B [Mammaliicoccus]EZX23335.1 hypothetical protein V070_01054 [Staphylococcus aureus C0673]MBF9297295.1 Na(+)/H(+) antiporter subunit B [Staphylococcus schleiferi]MBN4908880.1 Na(+)/H(+) antiporter subunit B [Staphylococcus sp. EG-SA-13]OOV37177.1 Na(+)/H(+) antiporter subunit B [Staphylococcus sp. MB371]PCQ21381.1 Na(+)/H(+) antiporter subunit B [Klebsiella pneumoniae]RXY90204.1 Na(+)/H(+) antiporter subunit B [Salmonella sp. 3DZ2-4SM]HCW34891.1